MEDKSLIHLIPVLWSSRILIVSCVIAAAVLTSIVMILKPNYYQSYTTFYPVNSALLEPAVQINDRPIDYYGDDRDVDRLLSMSHSTDIAQALIQNFNLDVHYGIDTTDTKGKTRLLKRFKKLYRVQKTEYDAVELSIEDRDPKMAKALVEACTKLIDQKAKNIIVGSQQKLLDNLKATFLANSLKLNFVSDSLMRARQKYGIYNTETQAEALTTLEINSPGNRTLQSRINNYRAGISQVNNLEATQKELNEGLAKDALQMQQIESSIATSTSSMHIIEEAFEPIEKSRPYRSLYVLGVTFLTGVFVSGLILIRENIRDNMPG